ncbi:MAG: hypothetical protein RLZ70_1514 [Verrucomicrobiota bacterium]
MAPAATKPAASSYPQKAEVALGFFVPIGTKHSN